MSWSGESDNHTERQMGANEKWKARLGKIEQIFNNIRQLTDETKRKFLIIKNNRSEFKNLENERQSLNNFVRQLTAEIAELEKSFSTNNNQEYNAQKLKIKDLRKRAAEQTKIIRDLCANINMELKNREMARKKEISITSHELDFNEDSMRHNEQMTVDDVQLKLALEEQKQMENINKDVLQLEDLFFKLNTMVQEQGDVVARIEMNVEDAYVNTGLGAKELEKAVDYKKSATKKKCIIILIILAIVGILALIIGLSLGLKK